MDTQTIYLTGNSTLSGSLFYDEISVRGHSTVVFNYTQLDAGASNVSRILITPGDGSDDIRINADIENDHVTDPITYNFFEYGTVLPVSSFSHTYIFPDQSTSVDYVSLSAQVIIRYSNYTETSYIIPIKLYKNSYYDVLGEINILDTQLVDNDNNDVFCVIETRDGDVINIILS